jgi:hypothetical protein
MQVGKDKIPVIRTMVDEAVVDIVRCWVYCFCDVREVCCYCYIEFDLV